MKIIVADDDPVTRMLIVEKLTEWGYKVFPAEDGIQALELMEKHPDVQMFIFDWQMPNLGGIELCIKIKSKKDLLNTYIIIITGKKATHHIVEALNSGADEFISKPFIPEELKARLSVGKRIINYENMLVQETRRDPLTGIYNHRTITDELFSLWTRSKRDQSALAVLMLDIDHFKKVNDTHGHPVGDAALKKFCQQIKKELRPYDIFGRYGGEEFTICLPSTDADQAISIAERIRSRIKSMQIEAENLSFTITVSIGIATYSDDQQSYKELLINADRAAYHAKNKGRDCVVYLEKNA